MIFVHREASPIGPPLLEWLIARVFRKRMIYDFDDALWLTDRTKESILFRAMKWRGKVSAICRWSYKVSCGNDFLCRYALQFNNRVVYNPTTIDTDFLHIPARSSRDNSNQITVGWTGSYSTLKYLETLEAVLKRIEAIVPSVRFLVIADKEPALNLKAMEFRPWSIETEIRDLNEVDIGIMPLPDDEWSKGKCGFKALQYMALEIPTVASPTGVNSTIIEHGINGFLAVTQADWETYLLRLIENKDLRVEMGRKGRQKVVDHFSVHSNESRFLSLFE
jgi:glycosyltransferase involved in cell wall biosynthesis